MQPFVIDTHAHIYLPEFDADREAILKAALEQGVQCIFMPAVDAKTHQAMLGVEEQFSFCKSMMGLHPCSVMEDFELELDTVRQYYAQRNFVAIGEIGLDFYWDLKFSEQQYIAFRRQIELALELDLPIVIHSRNAVDECINVVAEYPKVRGVFHCFSGTTEQAQKIIALNFYLGIGGVLTFKNSGLDKVLSTVPLQHLVLETDAPYLSPVPHRGKRNEPAYLPIVADKLAQLHNCTLAEVAEATTRNAENLFRIKANT